MSVGPWQIVLIALLVLLLFGAGRLSEIGKGLGEGIRNFKKGISEDDDDEEEEEREIQHKRVKGKPKKDPKRLPEKRRVVDDEDEDDGDEDEDDGDEDEAPAPRKKSRA